MHDLISTERVRVEPDTSAIDGHIAFSPSRALWLLTHGVLGAVGVLFFPSPEAPAVFVLLTAITICAGHSVGMHRLLIHRSFETRRSVEYFLVWLGTLVGMAGPFGMIKAHDMRDWHQRQTDCPPHPAHAAGFARDAWWQLCCQLELSNPPTFVLEDRVKHDRVYWFMERYWMLQQVPLALALYCFGGLSWVLWGCCLRTFVSLVGHWMMGHFAHSRGQQGWKIDGLPVQGYNLPGFGLVTFGENWHGNHHAFPYSAQLGTERGQLDPGYLFIRFLERVGLAHDVKTPGSMPERRGLTKIVS